VQGAADVGQPKGGSEAETTQEQGTVYSELLTIPPKAMSACCPEETSTTKDAILFFTPVLLGRK